MITAKEYLGEVGKLETRLDILRSEIEYYENLACGLQSQDYSTERVDTSIKPDKMSKAVIKILEKRKEYEKALNDCVERRENIIREINSLDNDNHVKILYGIYVSNKPIAEIANEINYASRYVMRLHSDALTEFEKIINK